VQSAVQSLINTPRNLNLTDTWIGANYVCRSSTMVRAAAHRRVGLDDPDMVRAPDYELWTRFLRAGLRMEVLPQQLTFMRIHSRQVTHADPLGTFLEMSFAALRNLVPRCEQLALYSSYTAIIAWIEQNPAFNRMLPIHAFRLIGMFVEASPVSTFHEFRTLLESDDDRPYLADLGKRGLALMSHGTTLNDLWKQTTLSDQWKQLSLQAAGRLGSAIGPAGTSRLRAIKGFVTRRSPRRNE
jgi:hypothetical protein